MSSAFLISGLPRSRTAWLSVFFTHYPSFCLHEGMGKYDGDFKKMIAEISAAPHPVGNSDSSLSLYATEVIAAAASGQVKLAVVDRDLSAVIPSLEKFYDGKYDAQCVLGSVYGGHQLLLASSEAFVIRFEDLDDEEKVAQLYEHLIPGQPFPTAWYRQMRLLRVNQILDKAVAALDSGRAS